MGPSQSPRWRVGSSTGLRRRLLHRVPTNADFGGLACTRLPDGTAVALTGMREGGWVQVWDLATGAPRGRPLQAPPEVRSPRAPKVACAQLPDRTPVAVTAGPDRAVRVWDLVTGRLRGQAAADQEGGFASVACAQAPDGTPIAVTGGTRGPVQLWDVATVRPYGPPLSREPGWSVVACTRLADDTPVAVIAVGEALEMWELVTGQRRGGPIPAGFDVMELACTRLADGTPLAVAGSDRLSSERGNYRYGAVQAWDLATGRRYGPALTGHGGEIEGLACRQLPAGPVVAVSVDRYGVVRAWDLATGQPHGPRLPHVGEPPEVECTQLPDGTPVVVVLNDELRVWSLDVEPSPDGLAGNLWLVGCTRQPDGGELVVTVGVEAGRGHGVQLWDAATGRPRGRLLAGQAGPVRACTRTRDGAAVVMAPGDRSSGGGSVRRWDLATGTATELVLAGLTGEVDILDCAVLRDGTALVLTGNGSVRAWDAGTGLPYGPALPVAPGWRRALSVVELADGTLVAVHVDDQSYLQAWDLRTGRPHGPRLAGPAATTPGQLSLVAGTVLPDGTLVAVTTGDAGRRERSARVWDLAGGGFHDLPSPLRGRWQSALACTRLPDGTVLVAAGGGDPFGRTDPPADGLVQVWDLATGDERRLLTLADCVTGLAFTAQHRLVVATELDVAAYDLG